MSSAVSRVVVYCTHVRPCEFCSVTVHGILHTCEVMGRSAVSRVVVGSTHGRSCEFCSVTGGGVLHTCEAM